jgi:hypothetical protein
MEVTWAAFLTLLRLIWQIRLVDLGWNDITITSASFVKIVHESPCENYAGYIELRAYSSEFKLLLLLTFYTIFDYLFYLKI